MKFSTLLLTSALNFAVISSACADFFTQDSLPQTDNLVKAGNKFVTLLGNQVKEGQKAPDFKVVNDSFGPVSLSDFANKPVLISVVPSLDTGVCSLQTKRFNEEVANLPGNVVMMTISNDLPFAQKRFCKTENIDKVKVLSDAVWRDFGSKYGLLIKDMGLLTRAIFIIDEQRNIAYKELVANISQHPNYDNALATLKALNSAEASTSTTSATEDGAVAGH
ncbi:thiol peroxidase [Thalassotalea euphylliae]|uniref:Thiol peroxidase n=1 Tax=Thalassotalea euphylliae TaxID=1655234 RepID=A0A3E0U6T7_9GAMM|nr:thiol peroxidase [Thalassotalea euphylliae]REL32263.1 thiol peroxidase [Thalassotalea euphylliae]